MMHLIKCYIITAYVRDKSWSVIFCKREMNIVVPDVDGFETLFVSRGFCFWDYRVGLYSLCFKVEVTLLLMLSLVDSDRYLQLASLPNSNLTPDEQKALKRLKTDENIVILPADKGTGDCCYGQDRLQRKMDSLVLTTNRPTKHLTETRRPHCNANWTTNCLHGRKPTRSTFDSTTDWGVVFRSHPNCMDYQNYTNPTYLCGP